jgi:hypothetical protein
VVALSELQQKLAECDENLSGTVLTPAERAQFTAVRKALYLALHPETVAHTAGAHAANAAMGHASAQNSLASKPQSFTEDTARRTGRCRRVVEMDAQRGTIPHDVLEIVSGTDLGRGKAASAKNALAGFDHDNNDLGASGVSKAPSFAKETARRTGTGNQIAKFAI